MKDEVQSREELRAEIERYATGVPEGEEATALRAFQSLKHLLNSGAVRAAEPAPDGTWRVNRWVKSGILLGFRLGRVTQVHVSGPFPFFDKDTYPLRTISAADGIRLVPGGSTIRDGCYVAPGVVCMPPMYINVG
ncbi:MAG: 2,3,4,5-tetrahydropyridine-2,6-dicarboxylate N-succinyltransferase, partial [Gemmatimonadales bacterium]